MLLKLITVQNLYTLYKITQCYFFLLLGYLANMARDSDVVKVVHCAEFHIDFSVGKFYYSIDIDLW
jgi:hypothetical protein